VERLGRCLRLRTVQRQATLIAALAVCVLATACSTPGEFSDRADVPSCGEVLLDHAETIPTRPAKCMDRAQGSSDGAELVVRPATFDGGPITVYLRYEPGSQDLRVWTDNRKDDLRSSSWSLARCKDPTTVLDWQSCRLIKRWR
jgi:hypothetical protein